MAVVFVAMVVFPATMRVRFWDSNRQSACQIGRNGLIGIGFRGYQSSDAFHGQTLPQTLTHAAGNQNLRIVQRLWRVWRTFMKTLIFR